MQERTGRRDDDALTAQRMDGGPQRGEGAIEVRPPDVAAIHDARGEHEAVGQGRQGTLQHLGGADQVQMQAGDGQRQGRAQILAKVAEVGGEEKPQRGGGGVQAVVGGGQGAPLVRA